MTCDLTSLDGLGSTVPVSFFYSAISAWSEQ